MGVALRWACLVFYEDKRFEHVFHPILQNSWWSDDLTFSWPCESRWSENTLNAVSLYTRVLLSLGRVLLSLGFKDLDIVWSARAVLLISPNTEEGTVLLSLPLDVVSSALGMFGTNNAHIHRCPPPPPQQCVDWFDATTIAFLYHSMGHLNILID